MGEWMLRGREHLELAAIELRVEADAAIALSIGGAPKRYTHTDPNEDVALLVVHADRVLLAVADGHGGYEAAEIALQTIQRWDAELGACTQGTAAWGRLALDAFVLANQGIRAAAARGGRRLSRTTLAFARVEPQAGAIRWASIGDSHVFHAANGVLDLAHAHAHDHPSEGGTFFLGVAEETQTSLAAKCRIGEERLAGTQALVLATDGLSERGVGVDEPEDAVATAVLAVAALPPAERAAALARSVVEAALAAHRRRRSGDNVAAALWLAPSVARIEKE
jgi:serine/threonine protein phosphatase PrpC